MGRNIDESIRKIQKVGNTYTVSLPIYEIREARWKEGQKVVVEFDKRGKKFIIKDWNK